MSIEGFQRKYLRGLAHNHKAVTQIGRQGLTSEAIQSVRAALEDHELVKVSMHKPKDKKAMAAELAVRTESELCGLIGHTVILYRAHSEAPVIRLPQRPTPSTDDSSP